MMIGRETKHEENNGGRLKEGKGSGWGTLTHQLQSTSTKAICSYLRDQGE